MWSVTRTLSLIEDLHNTRCLWDVQCLDYKIRLKKDEALDVLGKKYGMNSGDIEKKIQSLKNQFRREHRKYMDAIRAGSFPRTCRWFGYEGLSFLLQVYESRGSRVPVEDSEDVAERYAHIVTPDNFELEDTGDTSDNVETEMPFQFHGLKRKKPQDESISGEALSYLKVLTQHVTRRDEFTTYGEHIANKLKYSGRTRSEIAIAQRRIDEICFQLNMGSFSQQSDSSVHDKSQQILQCSSQHDNSTPPSMPISIEHNSRDVEFDIPNSVTEPNSPLLLSSETEGSDEEKG